MVYLDSSNSPHNESVIELDQSEEGQQKTSISERAQSEQAPTGYNSGTQMQQSIPTTMLPMKEEQKIEEPTKPIQLQMETPKSPASSLTYKTPPSSPQLDTISDLDEDNIRASNEIQ